MSPEISSQLTKTNSQLKKYKILYIAGYYRILNRCGGVDPYPEKYKDIQDALDVIFLKELFSEKKNITESSYRELKKKGYF